jgi:hypothetical protein
MTSNLAQLITARAGDRSDMRIGTVDAQTNRVDAAREAAGARFIRETGVGAVIAWRSWRRTSSAYIVA